MVASLAANNQQRTTYNLLLLLLVAFFHCLPLGLHQPAGVILRLLLYLRTHAAWGRRARRRTWPFRRSRCRLSPGRRRTHRQSLTLEAPRRLGRLLQRLADLRLAALEPVEELRCPW